MYYTILLRDNFLEYHVSSDKEECETAISMSRRVDINKASAKYTANAVTLWLTEANFYECKYVEATRA